MKSYQKHIVLINALDWSRIDPLRIISVSLLFAQEFAMTVRSCSTIYQDSIVFRTFANEEIDTENLKYEDYQQRGDHWQFLAHFVGKIKSQANFISLGDLLRFQWSTALSFEPIDQYLRLLADATPEQQMVTLVSREQALQGIFKKILGAHNWDARGYGFYRHFLERHLELDGEDGGHEDLMRGLIDLHTLDPLQETFLEQFWIRRLAVYQSL